MTTTDPPIVVDRTNILRGLQGERASAVPSIGLAAIVAAVGLFALFGLHGNYNDSILVLALCFAFAVLGMVVQVGHSGQLAFHQSVFMMFGAYGVGVLNTKYHWPVLLAAVVLVVAAAILGGIIGSVATRVPGFALALATLFFSVIASGYVGYSSYLGQATGITSIGYLWSGPSYVSSLERSGAVAVVLLALCVLACGRIMRSGIGLELLLVGQNERMAAALGINTRRRKLEVFILSASLAALGGAVFAGTQSLVSPTNFDQTAELTLLIMLFVGGRSTIVGGLVGTLLIQFLANGSSAISSRLPIIEGVLFTLILLYAPEGLIGVIRRGAARAAKLVRGMKRPEPGAALGGQAGLATEPPESTSEPPRVGSASARVAASVFAGPSGHEGRSGPAEGEPVRGPAEGGADTAGMTEEADTVALECREITKRFGGVVAVDAVSLKVHRLGVHALCGPNGAGKSTLFELISGGIGADGGRIFIQGRDVTRTPAYLRAQLGVARTLQAVRLMNSRSVLDNVAVAAVPSHRTYLTHALFKSDLAVAHDRALEIIEELGLGPYVHQRVGDLTLEAQRMVELARALVTRPSVILLDEPASGLSAPQRARLAELLVGLGERMTVVLVEHDLQLVADIAQEIFVLLDGRLVFTGDATAFRASEVVRTELMGLMANEVLETAGEHGVL